MDNNKKMFMIYLLIVFFATIMIAVSLIGMEAYNSNEEYKSKKKANYDYLLANVILSTLVVITAIVGYPASVIFKKS